jgi:hypothetical protein
VAAELWLGLGLAVAKMLLRAADKSDTADALDDAHGGWSILRAARRQETALGKAIAEELKQHLGGASGAVEGDLRAAVQDVTDLLSRLAKDEDAVIAAATYPDQFLDYAKKHGGDQKRRLISERAALVLDRVLEAASAEFARLAPSSSRFVPSALAEILRQLPGIAEDAQQAAYDARRAADGVGQLLRRGDRDVVGASRAATDAGTRLGRPVPNWSPAELGVHATIVVDGVTGLTPYILRDHDIKLREALAELRQTGAPPRLVNVVGTSCTGKTRTLYEAVDQVLADWTLVKPADIDELTRMLYAGIPKHTVVWLDELQDFLTIQGVDAARAIHQLLDGTDSPTIVFAATIWPGNLSTLEQRPDPADARTGLGEISNLVRDSASDRYAVPNAFANDELRTVSRDDPRIAKAIQYAADGQLTQVLAGGTQLVRRVYTDQQPTGDVFSPAARAVILAAADLRRIGYPNPLPRWAIAGAAPGYLEPAEQRRLNPATWSQDALDEAAQDAVRHRNHGLDIHQRGVPALLRLWLGDETTDSTGDIEHYELHDYLLQHHLNARRHTATTTHLWNTLVASNSLAKLSPQIAVTVGRNAELRGLYTVATSLLTSAADKGDYEAQSKLADLLTALGREDDLRDRADKGDSSAQFKLDEKLLQRGDEEALQARADMGDRIAARWLADIRGEEGLRARANEGTVRAMWELIDLLVEGGDEDNLRNQADNGDWAAEYALAELLGRRGDEAGLRDRADQGEVAAEYALAELLGRRGDAEGLRDRADQGDSAAQSVLAELLAQRGDEAGLRDRAANGDRSAQAMLKELLARRTELADEEGLRSRAVKGDEAAESALAELLAQRGDEEGLSDRAAKGEWTAQRLLAELLTARGDAAGLRHRADKGDWVAEYALAELLAQRGDEAGLRDRADKGEWVAQFRLTTLLGKRGAVLELQNLVHSTCAEAARTLIKLYEKDRRGSSRLELDVNAEPRPIT